MNIDLHLDMLYQTRVNLLKFFDNHSLDQLNKIPEGFNNNLIWNIAHCLVTQQLLVYKLSGSEMSIGEELVNSYRKGTKPEGSVDQAFVDDIKQRLSDTIDQLSKDYHKQIFGDYASYPTSYGVTLNSVEEAICFNNMHEAMHLGTMIALGKFV